MRDVLGLLAYLVLPLIGSLVWRLEGVRELAVEARVAIAGAAGALLTAMVMTVMSLAGIEWSRTRLIAALLLLIAGGLWKAPARDGKTKSWRSPAIAVIAVFLAITAYGLLTARETTGDLLFFWGPKGVHFARAGKIDVDYLRDPNSYLAHRDYPPLLPLVFAWSNTVSRDFSWWAAVLLSGLCLAGVAAIVRACARDDLSALLTISVLAWAFARARVAGGADPLLLFFEATAVAALLFLRDERSQTIVAAIGIAGAVMTKVEGASFAIAVILALVIDRRPWKRIVMIVLPALVLLGAWITFLVRNDLLDTYRGPGTFSLQYVREVLAGTVVNASYDALWIPWIAPLIVVLLGSVRRARLPLSIALLSLGATLYVYLKSPNDPSILWIPSSAQRVLLTPLLMLLMAAAAAHAATFDERETVTSALETTGATLDRWRKPPARTLSPPDGGERRTRFTDRSRSR
jgi:hypothetical protein